MSIALYQYRLYWDGRQGAMRNGNDTRILVEPPVLPGAANAELAEIDYAPEVDVAQVRERTSTEWREMTPDEVAAAEALLASLTGPDDEWIKERAA